MFLPIRRRIKKKGCLYVTPDVSYDYRVGGSGAGERRAKIRDGMEKKEMKKRDSKRAHGSGESAVEKM